MIVECVQQIFNNKIVHQDPFIMGQIPEIFILLDLKTLIKNNIQNLKFIFQCRIVLY